MLTNNNKSSFTESFHKEERINTLVQRVRDEGISCPEKANIFLSRSLGQPSVAKKVINILGFDNQI